MTPWIDPIVDEIHRYRAERAARFNYDIHAMRADTNAFYEKFKKECAEKGIILKEVEAPSAQKKASLESKKSEAA